MRIIQKQFKVNPVYLEKFFPCRKRFAVLMGGAGSGKSIAAVQKVLHRLKTEPGHRFLVVRKVASTLRDSVFRAFKDEISKHDLEQEFTVYESTFKILHKSGNEILFYGLDDVEKMKSIAGITGIWIEEATELEQEDYLQLNLRLRGETKNYKQIVLTFNPIREDHWLKEEFFDKEDDQIFTLITTYRDNVFLDDQYRQELETRFKSNVNMYRVYVLGEWGVISTGDNFYKNFDYSKHVQKLIYSPELPLCLSMDFNTQPFCAGIVFQILGAREFWVIDEICLKSPKNTIQDVCKEFERRYSTHAAGVRIFGDASGKNDDTKHEKGFNCFTVIENNLSKFHPTINVPSKNPPVMMRGLWINQILFGSSELKIFISDKCKNLINDFSYGKEAEDGGKAKTMTKDKETGASYQKYFHCADAFDYGICQTFQSDFTGYQRGGSRPMPIIHKAHNNSRSTY
jgi:phage terminase large subunit